MHARSSSQTGSSRATSTSRTISEAGSVASDDQTAVIDVSKSEGINVADAVSMKHSALTQLAQLLNPINIVFFFVTLVYYAYQFVISALFTQSYRAPKPGVQPFGRVAVIGAGLTGISTAADLVAHGFEVVIYEKYDKVGGIWAQVNSTSRLQLNSLMYRFHPSVKWSEGYPKQREILGQIEKIWKKYHLEGSTRFNTEVKKVARHPKLSEDPRKGGHARWVINNGEDGVFDAVVTAIGTCGKPKMMSFEGQDSFKGKILHSSQLDDAHLKGKKIVIIGSGASGVEAAELAIDKQAKGVVMLARDDKWIIPRRLSFDILIALQPFGRQIPLSFIPEWYVRLVHYRDQRDISPAHLGLFEGTPIVNNSFLSHLRQGKASYKRGDTIGITEQGVKFSARGRNSKPGDKGEETVETADVIILATGYERPSIDMLPKDLFPKEGERSYARPDLYLGNFATEDWSVLMTNAAYMDAIGTVGNWHINIYARILMMFLLDRNCRPSPKAAKVWVDMLNWLKSASFGQGKDTSKLAFFTYFELCLWLVSFHLFRPYRLLWLPFVLFGWGVHNKGGCPTTPKKGTERS